MSSPRSPGHSSILWIHERFEGDGKVRGLTKSTVDHGPYVSGTPNTNQ